MACEAKSSIYNNLHHAINDLLDVVAQSRNVQAGIKFILLLWRKVRIEKSGR